MTKISVWCTMPLPIVAGLFINLPHSYWANFEWDFYLGAFSGILVCIAVIVLESRNLRRLIRAKRANAVRLT